MDFSENYFVNAKVDDDYLPMSMMQPHIMSEYGCSTISFISPPRMGI